MADSLTEPAKLLLLASLLAKDRIITNNGKAFLKELILRRDARVVDLLQRFESKDSGDANFLDSINELIERETFDLYQDLFSDCTLETGKSLSKGEREDNGLMEEKSLIYGEVDFFEFVKVLKKISPAPGGTFYDLGSGTGKAVFAARFTQDFDRCIGVELLEGLHGASAEVVEKYNGEFRGRLNTTQRQHAACFQGSFLEHDWSDGDVVFANSTCFGEDLMADMSRKASSLAPGAHFITFTKGLESDDFEVVERKRYNMSWGPATVFIHRRKDNAQP